MRVGVNCFLLRSDIGGLKQYFFTLFDYLLENDSANEYVFFCFPQNMEELATLRSDRWKRNAIHVKDQNQIAEHLSSLDVYFCPFNALWPRPAALPSVMTLVDIQEKFFPHFFTRHEHYNRAYHYKASTRAADRVITISEYSKSTIQQHHRIASHKVLVAHLCADPTYTNAETLAIPPPDPLPFRDYLLFPANRWFHKNHDTLLRALKLLRDSGATANLVITGYDVQGGFPVFEKAAEYGVRDLVHTAGYVSVAQMAYLYQHAEMLVFPSLFEGFGMPPVEAMAVGCPVASSNATCLPEICGDAAEYFDPKDPGSLAKAVSRIREDSGYREALIAKGRLRAANFSQEKMARVHLRAFEEAVASFSPASRLYRKPYELFHRRRVGLIYWTGERLARRKRADCEVRFGNGWYGVEQDGRDWFRWSSGHGVVHLQLRRAAKLRLCGELASLERPNAVEVLVDGKSAANFSIEGEFGFKGFEGIQLDCAKGRHRIEFISASRGVPTPQDRRALAVALRNLKVATDSPGFACEIVQ